jgi:hypothetical protein
MSERNRRGRRDYREWRGGESGRGHGRSAWDAGRRDRYPDEPYGGEREAGRNYWEPGRGQYYGQSQGGERDRGSRDDRGFNRGDYRGDFGPEGERQWQKPGHARESYGRDDAGWSGRGEWGRGDERDDWNERDRAREDWGREWGQRASEGWERGRRGLGGFGSEFGAWRSGATFGFGPEEEPEGRFDDTDWTANRSARGRGAWAGDWSTGRASQERSATRGMGGSYYMREDYSGRGPRDYRRSDDRIREEVCDRLTDDPMVDAGDVNIRVEGGEVTLTGTVGSREQKRRAEDCVERVTGVREVLNQLRVARADTASGAATQSSSTATRAQRAGTVPSSSVAADRERQS